MVRAHIGTSGFYYDHWKDGIFYPPDLAKKEWLRFYASRFETVELNTTFYRLPAEETFRSWYQITPRDFVFALKGSRFLSHVKKFKDAGEVWNNFYHRAKLLKEKLGPVLFQTPPSWKKDAGRLESFLKIISKKLPLAFEFRHPSWFDEEVYRVLKKFNVSLCFVSSPDWPTAEVITTDFIYIRFHGEAGLYSSNYSDRKLSLWAKKFKKWIKEGRDVYAYFNNDALGYAPKNALTLIKLVDR